tara:strand:+ start:296 stop:1231 length:936 start_codon:yes stop_codon:yes gene_type:complete
MSSQLFAKICTALVTPFEADGGIAVDAVAPLVEHMLSAGIKGFYVNGSTGAGFAQTTEERKTMLEATIAATAGRVPVMCHVGGCDVADAVALAEHAKTAGATAVSSVTPGSYGREEPSDAAACRAYFMAVASATDLPFYAYLLGGAAPSAAAFLAEMEGIPNLVGVKYTKANFYVFQQIIDITGAQAGKAPLNMLSGMDECMIAGAIMGADGAIGSTYNVMPATFSKMRSAFDSGDIAAAQALQTRANRAIALMIEACNCAERGTNIIGGIKAVLRARGIPVGMARARSATPMGDDAEAAFVAKFLAMDLA